MNLHPGTDPEAVEQLWRQLESVVEERSPLLDRTTLRRAFDTSVHAHDGQRRQSGEPYITHVVAVSRILLELLDRRADTTLISAALLHDVVEDSPVTHEQLREHFGDEVARLVDGVTKIGGFHFRSPAAEQAENFRKMLLSMAQDIRVILIKLADRLHNMRTLSALEAERVNKIAQETRDIYAPLAHRLGIGQIKWELEDLAFKHLEPEHYRRLKDLLHATRAEREAKVDEVRRPLAEALAAAGIVAEVVGRPKHFYSIYRKMGEQERSLESIYDLLGLRIITSDKNECYSALGVVHDIFVPVHDRFTDYIATPKTNMYQSLHTTVIGPRGEPVEIQIRTREMHRVAELGIAAHYTYKEGVRPDRELVTKLGGFVEGLPALHAEGGDPGEYLESLRTSLYQDEVFVFTPKGDLRQLPMGSTALDLAYLIHTEIGHRTVGARVGGKIVPLKYVLKNGDTVEIITQRDSKPSPMWLRIVHSPHARQKIRRWLKSERLDQAVSLGRELIEREARKRRVKIPGEREIGDAAQSLNFQDATGLFASVGEGHTSAVHVLDRLHPPAVEPASPEVLVSRAARPQATTGIRVHNVSNLLISFAKCCQPVPGDRITGIVTRGRGVSVHRMDCPNAFEARVGAERKVDVEWDVEREASFYVKILIFGTDRKGLLADIADAMAKTATNIKTVEMQSSDDASARGAFVVGVSNLAHLERVMAAVRAVKGVSAAERQQVFSVRSSDGDGMRRVT